MLESIGGKEAARVGGEMKVMSHSMTTEEKKKIVQAILPEAVLKAVTPLAQLAVSHSQNIQGLVVVRQFPFRVGRESRVKVLDGRVERIERVAKNEIAPNNDLYLLDTGELLNISREHFQIEKEEDCFYLHDRNSACGSYINEDAFGREEKSMRGILQDGDIITIGTRRSPYQFQFIRLDQFEVCER